MGWLGGITTVKLVKVDFGASGLLSTPPGLREGNQACARLHLGSQRPGGLLALNSKAGFSKASCSGSPVGSWKASVHDPSVILDLLDRLGPSPWDLLGILPDQEAFRDLIYSVGGSSPLNDDS